MKNVRLFIGAQEVNFTTEPDILFNFSVGDLTDPTAVKNSFTKQITIEGTQANNALFGDLWQLDRAMVEGTESTGIYFNPSKKVPFQLFNNGEIYQEGYCKLDSIERQGQKVQYKVSLFGGLGEFFYNLSYKATDGASDENTKKSLADLDYGVDLGFTICKETISSAWTALNTSNKKWNTINFAPAYNGHPNDFSSDTVLVNTNGTLPFPTTLTTGGTTYGSVGGYELATMPEEYTDLESRDLRSYLQRPVIRMKSIIDACCNPDNNGGYTVYLDPLFFNDNNPYYEKTWVTLPLLNEYEWNTAMEMSPEAWSPTLTLTRGTPNGNTSVAYTVGGLDRTVQSLTLSVKPDLLIDGCSYSKLYTAEKYDWTKPGHWDVFPFSYIGDEHHAGYKLGGIGVQAVAYLNGQLIAASDFYVFCTSINGNYVYAGTRNGKSPIYKYGAWNDNIGGHLKFKQDSNAENIAVDLKLNLNNRPYDTIKINVEALTNDTTNGGMRLFSATTSNTRASSMPETSVYRYLLQNHYDYLQVSFKGAEETLDFTTISNREMPQSMLLDTENSPADYLLSFTKMFGLYFLKDADQKKISILTRHSFYHRTNIIDISEKIDRSKATTINPLVMDSKWYDWKNDVVESSFANYYNKTTSMTYGMKRVNTGYEFNAEAKDLYKNTIFKSAIECLEKSRAFSYNPSGETGVKQWMDKGFDLTVYHANPDTGNYDTETITVPKLTNLEPINKPKWPFYDLYPKAQFRDEDNGGVDGRNVLLFFNDKISTTVNGVDLHYWLTDDLTIMFSLNNNNACWIYTTSSADTGGNTIALPVSSMPRFSRYVADEETNVIQWSLDFGEPRELYIPTYATKPESTIYYNFWKKYIEDLYDVDNKVVDAYVFLEFKPNESLLRDFYYFDNAVWRINKITDWNLIKEGTTKVQFVKVKNTSNYDSYYIYGSDALQISANITTVPVTGGDVTFTVTCIEPDMQWVGYDNWRSITGSIPSGTGNGSFTIHFEANPSVLGTSPKVSLYSTNYNNVVSNKLTIYRDGVGLLNTGCFILPETINIPATGGQYLARVYYKGLSVDWNIISDSNWLTIDPVSGHSSLNVLSFDDKNLYINYSANTGISARTATLRTSGTDYTNVCNITQEGVGETLEVYPGGLTFSAVTPTAKQITITSNTDWTIELEEV